MRIHYTASYLLDPQHKITVNLVGLGGTGSQVLSGLARLHEALIALGHPGIHVKGWDIDTISEANIGRQLFSPADIGMNKATCLITRINRYFGYEWEAHAEMYTGQHASNITITCIDTISGRLEIARNLRKHKSGTVPYGSPFYWLDLGNLKTTGQAVLGTLSQIRQPKSEHETVSSLPDIIKLRPDIKKIKETDQGPSCSLAEAINKQDLFINSTLAQLGLNIIWKLFRQGHLTHHGCYLNLETMNVNPIKI